MAGSEEAGVVVADAPRIRIYSWYPSGSGLGAIVPLSA
eukprot:CAMPEP_0179960432 /NCGR_PEP_ID=MMETSP0983-20121128/29125_1 /TAXON_ID=483367 /ORGANISM="non described non described, Strain CCMP 2436" /LENGTH=37 /DNA_ID= /DNA_START= /DNA_END= /DNA_ORIENTATION=